MTVYHPKVKKILRQCERRIMKMIGKGPVTIFIINSHPTTIPYEDIERIVCEVMEMSTEEMFKSSRRNEFKTARQLLCFFARSHTSMSYLSIGEKVGNYHHTTVIHSVERIKGLIESDDQDISRYVKEINSKIAQLNAAQR